MERYVQEALPLGKEAVAGALDAAGLAPGDVGLFAVVSCTGYATPGLDILLARDLGMPRRPAAPARRPHGLLRRASRDSRAISDFVDRAVAPGRAALLRADQPARPAGASGDLEQVVAHALFSDAAAAVVRGARRRARPPGGRRRRAHRPVDRRPHDLGRHRPRLPDGAVARGCPTCCPATSAASSTSCWPAPGCAIEDVAGWAVHPGGPRILDVVRDELGLAEEQMSRLPQGAAPSTATARRRRCCWCSRSSPTSTAPWSPWPSVPASRSTRRCCCRLTAEAFEGLRL